MAIDYTKIGKRIRVARNKKGWTQRKLADKVDMTTTHISHIENGTTKLGLPTIVDIANVLETTVDSLLCDSIVQSGEIYVDELSKLISTCTPLEIRYIIELAKPALEILRQTQRDVNSLLED